MLQQSKAHFFVAEKEIGGDGEMRAKHNFLMHRVDAVVDRLMRCGECDRLAFPIYFAARAQIDAGEQLDKRRFAGAVFADDRMDFTRLESKIDGLQRMSGAEALVEPLEDEKRRGGTRRACLVIASTDRTLLGLVHRRSVRE